MNDASTSPLFLTKAVVPYQLAAQLRIRNSYDWHQRVWECFPGRDGQHRDFLTRLDDKDSEYQLLIVSAAAPTRPKWCPAEAWGTKEIASDYFNCRRYAFQLRANPTKKVIDPNKPKVIRPDGRIDRNRNSRRVALTQPDELRAWLARKSRDHGFSVERVTFRLFGNQFFKKNGVFAPNSAVDFQGVLTVTDCAKFLEAFRAGLGSAKAFGFGLLVIAPISQESK